MSDFRSEAEKFVTAFLDYVSDESQLCDDFDKRTQKMKRSPGVLALIKQAESVFPARADNGKAETDKLTAEQVDEAIAASPNVVDTREMFSRRVASNGGTRGILRRMFEGDPSAYAEAEEFFKAEDGKKEFADKSVS